MTLRIAQQKLLWIWMVAGGGIILLMTIQGLTGKYEQRWDEAGKWLMSTIFPNLGVIVGAIAYSTQHQAEDRTIDAMAYRMAWGISCFYLLIVALVLLIEPLLPETGPLEIMARANVILGPLQGLVGTALGMFFVSRQQDRNPALAVRQG